jgi:hypothetical protein
MSTVHWDLLTDEQPFREAFDRIFLCEVMRLFGSERG